jgi:hypothetical protein
VGPLEVNTIKQSAVADVYKLIIADLQAAITVLPASYTGVDVGRATKYAAEGLLAQVYMARSGPTYAIDGPGLGLSEWNLALPLIQDIISSGLFTFTPVFSDVFSYTKQNPTVNKEAVFDIMYLTGTNGYGASFPVVLISNDYFKTLGDTKSNGNLENIPVSYDLIGKYAVADKRLLFTIHTAPYTSVAGSIVSNKPFFQKYVDFTKLASLLNSSDWGINFIAIRYTDILMMKAECILNGAPGVQADVDAIVNQVRTRAGVPAMTNVTLAQLFDERRREFACEGSRWFDLQRSGNLLTIMNAWIPVEDAIRKLMNPVVAGFIVYPVPQGQLDATPGLYTQGTAYQ